LETKKNPLKKIQKASDEIIGRHANKALDSTVKRTITKEKPTNQ